MRLEIPVADRVYEVSCNFVRRVSDGGPRWEITDVEPEPPDSDWAAIEVAVWSTLQKVEV